MSILGDNIRRFRKEKGLTQTEFAERIGAKRAVVGAYEEGRAEPRLQTLQAISAFFGMSIDALLGQDVGTENTRQTDVKGNNLRILPIALQANANTETIPLVPVKASAGYATGYGDVDFIRQLSQFQMPFPELSKGRTCRIFQIRGDSMLPVPAGAYVLAEYVQDWSSLKDYTCCIIVTLDDGVVYKRVVNQLEESKQLLLISDNKDYAPYTVSAAQVVEVWKARGYTTFDLPDATQAATRDVRSLAEVVMELKLEIRNLKEDCLNRGLGG